MPDTYLVLAIFFLLSFPVLIFLMNGNFYIRLCEKGIRRLAKKRNWEIQSIKQDRRYGYTDYSGTGQPSPPEVFNVVYVNTEGVAMDAVVSVHSFGLEVSIDYERPYSRNN